MSAAPWSPARPGDPLTVEGWERLQTGFREALAAHRHTGGTDGARLRGEDLVPGSALRVQSLDLSEGAAIGGRDLGEWMAEAERAAWEALRPRVAEKLPMTGGTLSGDLSVGGSLSATGRVSVGGRLVVGGEEVVPRVGVFGRWELTVSMPNLKLVLPRSATLLGLWRTSHKLYEPCQVRLFPGHVDPVGDALYTQPGSGWWILRGRIFKPGDGQAWHDDARVPAGPWTAVLYAPASDHPALVLLALWGKG